MAFVGHLGELSPYEARDAVGFVELMQQLKKRSGLTYRELEERAALSGDVLARSTLADTLRRTSLPRPDVLAAFVRACGDGQRVDAWLNARDRIAADITTVPTTAAGPGAVAEPQADEPTGPRPRRARGRTVALVVALVTSLVAALLALAAWGLLPDGPGDRDASANASAAQAPAEGWVTIRPADTPDLCLTEGRDRDGSYESAIAVQRPCGKAAVPRTYLESTGEGTYRIQWHHPEQGKGCLTVMSSGPAKGMLEPRDRCAQATRFRLELTAADGAEGFRLRPADSDRCIGIADDDTDEGAEAVEEGCTGGADQRFLIRTD
jgi:hypothetical protein